MIPPAPGLLLPICLWAVAWSAWQGARRLGLGGVERVTGAGLLGLAQVVVVSQLLGSIGWLRPLPLTAVHLGVAVAVAWYRRAATEGDPYEGPGSGWPVRFLLLLPICLVVVLLPGELAHGPGGWDAWTYHLGFPAEWVQWGDLRCSVQHMGDQAPPFYPLNSSLLSHLLLALAGTDLLGRFPQIIFLLLGALATFAAARRLGASPIASALGSTLAFSLPQVSGMATVAMADVSLAGAFALALWTLLRLTTGHCRLRDHWLHGLALGLLIGTKSSGPLFGLPLAVAGLTLALVPGRPAERAGRLSALATQLGGILPTGAYFYLRNWLHQGNPLYPVILRWGDRALFPGLYDRHRMAVMGFHGLDPVRLLASPEAQAALGGAGALLLVLGLAGLVRAGGRRRPGWIAAALLPAVLVGIFIGLLPWRYDLRFVLPVLPALALPAALGWDLLPRAHHRWLAPAMAAVAIGIAPGAVALRALGIALACLSALGAPGVSLALRRRPLRWIGGALLLLLGISLPWLTRDYEQTKWKHHPGPVADAARFVAEITRTRGPQTVAFAGWNAPYPLTGPGLVNRVLFVPRSAEAGSGFTGDRPYRPPGAFRDETAWRRNLDELGVDVLVTAQILDGWPPEEGWIASVPDFQPEYWGDLVRVWVRIDPVPQRW